MNETNFPARLKLLRKNLGKSQKEFSDLVNIPQPSISSYETGKTNPTIDGLIEIANKCDVSLDWLCGRQSDTHGISSMKEITSFFYKFAVLQEIQFDVQTIADDETHTWKTSLIFNGYDSEAVLNADFCNMIQEVHNNVLDLNSYGIDKQQFDFLAKGAVNYYHSPIHPKKYETLTRDERIKKHIEYLNNQLNP